MATLHSIEQRFLDIKTQHTLRAGQKTQLDRQINEARQEKVTLLEKQELYTKTGALLLKASETARALVQAKIEQLVTYALSGITGEPYEFKMAMVQHAGQWSVDFTVINPGGIELDPINSMGGGIADICSMALRFAILEMYEPRIEGPFLGDESMKFLSRDHQNRAVELFRALTEKTGRQILLVTHVPELAAGADKVLEAIPTGDTTQILDITDKSHE